MALALTSALVLLVVGFFLYLGGFARFPRGAVTLSSLTFVVLLGLNLGLGGKGLRIICRNYHVMAGASHAHVL
jgi:hypothetical protein